MYGMRYRFAHLHASKYLICSASSTDRSLLADMCAGSGYPHAVMALMTSTVAEMPDAYSTSSGPLPASAESLTSTLRAA